MGSVVGFVIIVGVILGFGLACLLFAFCYKFMGIGLESCEEYTCCKRLRGNNKIAGISPESSPPSGDSAAAQPQPPNANTHPTVTQPQPPAHRTNVRSGDAEPVVAPISEVAAIVIPVHVKVPKHGREIITPRAVALGPAKIAVEASPYESDIESQTGNNVSSSQRGNRERPLRSSQGAVVAAVAVDRRAPDWYNDLSEEHDEEAAVTVPTRRTSAGAANANSAAPSTRTSQTAVTLDHRAPTWYDD
jgi:hypothetical protein